MEKFKVGRRSFKHGDLVEVVIKGTIVQGTVVIYRGNKVYLISDRPTADGANYHVAGIFDEYGCVAWHLGDIDADYSLVRRDPNTEYERLTLIGKKQKPKATSTISKNPLDFGRKRQEAVAQAIQFLKTCPYKGTAIKVELEGQFGRNWEVEDCESWIEEWVEEHHPKTYKRQIYGRFLYDGSVDSEYTFTVPINHPEDVLVYIEAWNELGKEMGLTCATDGAGLHISILNSKGGSFTGNKADTVMTSNFAKAMTPLLPALLFLSSCDYRSRELDFRMPQVSHNKYSMIHLGNFFEFRCFETCYNYPERFYDYLVVIANCLQFYTKKPLMPKFAGTIGRISFPTGGDSVGRFFFSTTHIKALNLGLEILRPSYKSVERLKRERNYNVKVKKLQQKERQAERKWENEYASVADKQRKERLAYIKKLPTRYRDYLQEQLRYEYSHLLGYPVREIRDALPSGEFKLYQAFKAGKSKLALELIAKKYPYDTWRAEALKHAPTVPDRTPKTYITKKKEEYLNQIRGGGSRATLTV